MQSFGVQMDSITDESGCTAEGYLFNMAFVTKVSGTNPPVEWVDSFDLFFNVTSTCGGDDNGGNPSSECYTATLDG